MWIELIRNLTPDCTFAEPAAWASLSIAGEKLGIALPDELRGLLMETNGVAGEYGLGLIWPIERIVKENLEFRNYEAFRGIYMPFNHLLFFADAGTGDQFAFPIHADGLIHRPDVFAWNHEDDSRTWAAPSLKSYLEWWLTGRIRF